MSRRGVLLQSSPWLPLTEALRGLLLLSSTCSFVRALLVSGPYVRHNLSMTQTHLHFQLHLRALATRSSSSMVSCEIAHVFVLIREGILYNVTPLIFRCNHDNDVSLHVPAFAYEWYFTVMSTKEAKTCSEPLHISPWRASKGVSLSFGSTLTLIFCKLSVRSCCFC